MIISDDEKPWDLARQFERYGVSCDVVARAYQAWRERFGDSPECTVVTPEQAAQLPLCSGRFAGVQAEGVQGVMITVPLSPRSAGWSLTLCIPVRTTIPGPDMEPVGFAELRPDFSARCGPTGATGTASTTYTKTRWNPKYARGTA